MQLSTSIVPSETGGDDNIVDNNGNVIGSAHFITGQAGGSEAMHIRSDGRVTGTYEWPPFLNRFGGPRTQPTGAYELVFNNTNNPIGQEMTSQGSGQQPIQPPGQTQPTPSNPFDPALKVGQKRPDFYVDISGHQSIAAYFTLQSNGDILITDAKDVPRGYIKGDSTITDLSGNIIGRWYKQPDGSTTQAPAYNPAAPYQWAAVFNGMPPRGGAYRPRFSANPNPGSLWPSQFRKVCKSAFPWPTKSKDTYHLTLLINY